MTKETDSSQKRGKRVSQWIRAELENAAMKTDAELAAQGKLPLELYVHRALLIARRRAGFKIVK